MRKTALLATLAATTLAATTLAATLAAAQPQPGPRRPPDPSPTVSPGGAGPSPSGSATTTAPAGQAQRLSTPQFLQQAAMGDRFEIGSSRLALERAQNPDVKAFARQMVEDHTRTTQQRMELMQQLQGATDRQTSQRGTDGSPRAGAEAGAGAATSGGGMTTAQGGVQPEGLDARHQQMLAQLQAAEGPQFDRLYVQMQVQAHQEAVQLFEAYAQGGEDASLRQWTQRIVPDLRDHLQKAQRLHAQLGG